MSLPESPINPKLYPVTMTLEEVTVAHIRRVLEQCNGRVRKACVVLGISYAKVYRYVKIYNLKPDSRIKVTIKDDAT